MSAVQYAAPCAPQKLFPKSSFSEDFRAILGGRLNQLILITLAWFNSYEPITTPTQDITNLAPHIEEANILQTPSYQRQNAEKPVSSSSRVGASGISEENGIWASSSPQKLHEILSSYCLLLPQMVSSLINLFLDNDYD
ncbi:unnamed protein product [Protopolystoma xenopodis]|uniref:Uncharacterized protein n=1 Tax=Protopolystoma xenopodis TaxID=117903 RepID=A0A3S4ZQV6_9PLAT|nr:unnamed protein product [Protopolystoma xenopodis]